MKIKTILALAIGITVCMILVSSAECNSESDLESIDGTNRNLLDETDKRAPGWGKRAPGWGKRAPGWGKRAPGWGKRSPGWGKREPGWGKRNFLEETDKRAPGWGKQDEDFNEALEECVNEPGCLDALIAYIQERASK